MPPLPLVYKTGDQINLRAVVVDGSDAGHPIISIGGTDPHISLEPVKLGGYQVSVPQADLDRADHRDDSYREPTQAETDLAEMAGAVESPSPVLEFLEPETAEVGTDFTLRVLGTGFTDKSQILWEGTPFLTTLVSNTELTAAVSLGLEEPARPVPIEVREGDVTSNPLTLTLTLAGETVRTGGDEPRRGRRR